MEKNNEIIVIGHKNPDTDSCCSAIAYAYLKNQISGGNFYKPGRAGELNSETTFVLNQFNCDSPVYIPDVRARVSDCNMSEATIVNRKISVKKAWETLNKDRKSTLVVADKNQIFEGIITIGDIATSIMDVTGSDALARAKTPYRNIVETLEAEVLVGEINQNVTKGKVIVAAANPDLMEEYVEPGDMVILGDRYESQLCAIEMQAACLIVCIDSEVSPSIIELAKEKGCMILRTHYDSFITSRLLNQSIPIDFFMLRDDLTYFQSDNYIEEIRGIMAKTRHREYPVLDAEGKPIGMMTRHSLLEMDKKRVILVDHNEVSQAVDGLLEAEIEEIVDHHKIGFVETLRPVMFRNQPVGCTATIIYMMFKENQIEIPPNIAGLMCSAIISDTLLYRSPTCTAIDRLAAEELATIANIQTEEYAKAMFSAGSNLSQKTEKEIFYQDFKKFKAGDISYGVGQITSMDVDELKETVARMTAYMTANLNDIGTDMLFFMLTDILEESTTLLCVGEGALEKVAAFGNFEPQDNWIFMPGVVSRKKQLIPLLMQAIQE